ncbi:MAG TPA: putative porin [Chthoniobacterales bacterium]|nr:putative porin [Chthoniobacterales bacterium]
MLIKKFALIAITLSLVIAPMTKLRAQEAGALLDLLVKKKLITAKEAENVRAELKKEAAKNPPSPAEGPMKMQKTYDGKTYVEKEVPVEKTAADKWKLSTPITEIELFGDVRLRYAYNGGQTDDNSPLGAKATGIAGHDDWQERERERYRIRLGIRGTLLDDWFFGIRLETSTSSRSTNVTIGDDTAGNGPFAKASDSINVGQAYLGYKGFKDITLTGGRMPNPLVNTAMVWDPDINPEGLAEQWKHTFSFGETGGEAPSYSKDGKNIAPVVTKSEPLIKLDIFVNLAQFVYDDSNPENPLGPRATTTANGGHQLVPNTDAFLMAWQAGAKVTFPHGMFFQVAPTIYNYTGNGDTFNVHYQGGSPFVTNAVSLAQNQTGINSLLVFDMPMEFGWKIGKLPMHIFGDFAANLEGDDRATAAGHPGHGDQRYAFQAGAGVGQLKKKHDWQVDVYYQLSEQYALDPNLVDDDIFDGRQNMEGVVVKAGYALSDAVSVNFTYHYGWRHDDDLGTGGTPIAIGINPLDQYQLFFADLNIKF